MAHIITHKQTPADAFLQQDTCSYCGLHKDTDTDICSLCEREYEEDLQDSMMCDNVDWSEYFDDTDTECEEE